MPTISIGRESCGGSAPPRGGFTQTCATLGSSQAWPRNWIVNPAGLQAKADALGVEPIALLCNGCGRRLTRLTAAGQWP